MTHRANKSPRPPIQAPAALRIGLPHLLFNTRPVRHTPDPRHEAFVRLRELGQS